MTLEDLKNELHGRTFPKKVQISPDQIVVDVDKFLKVQFLSCESWSRDITKCPSYVRLIKFWDAIK
jgi:hypothetical protein